MPLQAILFDLDGTLLESIGGILASFEHVLTRFLPHKSFTQQELVMTIGEPIETQMLQFSGGDQELAPLMAAAYREHNRSILPQMGLYPGAQAALVELGRRGFKVGIVTSKSRGSTQISLDVHGLAPLLDLLLTADDTPRHKPDPMPLRVACEQLGLAATEIAYVGDSVHDIRCALGAGALAIAALWGPFPPATLAALGPGHMVESFEQLLMLPELSRERMD